jgi:hypothetical protein
MAKEVVAKRGCTCCGTGCVIPLAVIPGMAFALAGTLGLVATLVLSLPVSLGLVHLLARINRG